MQLNDTDLLLIIDVQNDFCPGGSLAVEDGDQVVPVINQLSTQFTHSALTQDWHPANHQSFASQHEGKNPMEVTTMPYGDQVLWPDHCVQGTGGADFHSDLNTDRAEMVVRKGYNPAIDSYSAFFENDHMTPTGLDGYLKSRGIKRLFMAGIATDFCVAYSAIDGCKTGYEVYVVEDGCRGIDLAGSLAEAWKAMKGAGVKRIQSSDIE